MYRRGRSPPRGYSPPRARRWSPPPPELHRRRSSPPRYAGPPQGDPRGPPPPLFDRRSPTRGRPAPEPSRPSELIPSVKVTFKNPLQRPEDDPNNIPIQPRHPPARTSVVVVPAAGRVPRGQARQRSRSPVRRRAMTPPRRMSPPRHRSPPRRAMSPPPYVDRLPLPARGHSPPPPLRGSTNRAMRDVLPPPGYGRRRSPSPPPYARGPPGMMAPPSMRGPPGRPLSTPRMGRPLSPPRMGRPLSPPRMGGRPLSPLRRRSGDPLGGPPMMPPDRGYPLLDRGGSGPGPAGPLGPGPRGGYPEPMDMLPNGRGGPPPAMRRGPPSQVENGRGGGYAAGLGPSSTAYRGGAASSMRGAADGGRGRPAAVQQPRAASTAAAAAPITDPQQMRRLRTVTLDRGELQRLARDSAESCFWYEDPQGDVQGPHSLVQLQQWMRFLSTAVEHEHVVAYEQFKNVAVWRKGMGVRVPLPALLAAAFD